MLEDVGNFDLLYKGEMVETVEGKILLVVEDAPPSQFKVWVKAPGEAPFEIWRSELKDITEPMESDDLRRVTDAQISSFVESTAFRKAFEAWKMKD